jgi:cell division transport system permease protein
MSLLITAWRILVSAWNHFSRNIWLSLTTIFVLLLALLSVNVLVGVNALLERSVSILEDKIDVSVYFKQDTPNAVVEQAKFFLASLPQVRTVDVLPADKALEAFKARHAADDKILGALAELDQNPLGPTIIVKARKTSDYSFLLDALQNPQFSFAIESKNYEDHQDTISRVRDIGNSVRVFGFGLIVVFALFSILIVFNTIRVAIYTQREEIGVMRLVGASNAYIRWPFVLEGIFLAAIAFVITGFIVVGVAAYLDPLLTSFFDGVSPGLAEYFITNGPRLVLMEGGGLAALVALSSWAAVGKYLRK